jgi:HEAT repeat protein
MRAFCRCLVIAFFLAGTARAAAEPPAESDKDVQAVTAAGLSADGPALLEFLRSRSQWQADRELLLTLTKQLGDSRPEVRARAAADLVARGTASIPVLRHAINAQDDAVIAARAKQCLERIEGPGGAALAAAIARLVAARKPAGAAEVLLAYLPFADDQTVTEEIGAALSAVAFPDGKADPAVLRALSDGVPIRRAVAAEALCRKDHPELWPLVRKLLGDPKPAVRLRAALALTQQQDVDSIPTLIELLADLPLDARRQVEDALQHLAGEWAPTLTLASEDEVSRRIRRDAWLAWWRNTDGAALLAEFRKRTLSPGEIEHIQALVGKLGSSSHAERQRAIADLVAQGTRAVPFVREALKAADPEQVRRAESCLRLLAHTEEAPLPLAAARMLALRKPDGAVEALLAYLPFAEGEALVNEVQEALTVLALQNGKPDPALVRALSDSFGPRRTAAAAVLARSGNLEHRGLVRKLAQDADPAMRMRVALALAEGGDKEALPLLIDGLATFPAELAGQTLEALALLAGDKGPTQALGSDAPARQKCRDAWAAWLRSNEAALDLRRLQSTQALLGYTLLVEVGAGGQGRVLEVGRDGKTRWQIDNLQYPVDAYVLGGQRVLITEYNGRRITERDFKGNVLWQKDDLRNQPTNAQRLANGNTFIATMNELLEVDRAGKLVFSHAIAGIVAAYKSRDGTITYLTGQGTCVRLDTSGKQIKSFPSGRGVAWTSGIDVLANGHVLVSQTDRGAVAELDNEGKTVWQATGLNLTTATRLANGHVLVASHPNQSVVELDRAGKTVWEFKDGYHQYRARRR